MASEQVPDPSEAASQPPLLPLVGHRSQRFAREFIKRLVAQLVTQGYKMGLHLRRSTTARVLELKRLGAHEHEIVECKDIPNLDRDRMNGPPSKRAKIEWKEVATTFDLRIRAWLNERNIAPEDDAELRHAAWKALALRRSANRAGTRHGWWGVFWDILEQYLADCNTTSTAGLVDVTADRSIPANRRQLWQSVAAILHSMKLERRTVLNAETSGRATSTTTPNPTQRPGSEAPPPPDVPGEESGADATGPATGNTNTGTNGTNADRQAAIDFTGDLSSLVDQNMTHLLTPAQAPTQQRLDQLFEAVESLNTSHQQALQAQTDLRNEIRAQFAVLENLLRGQPLTIPSAATTDLTPQAAPNPHYPHRRR